MTSVDATASTTVELEIQVLRLSDMAERDRLNLLAEMEAFGESLANNRISWDQAWREVLMAGARYGVIVERPKQRFWRR